jgi:hypothetical protein
MSVQTVKSPKSKKSQREELMKNREKQLTNKPELPQEQMTYDAKK